ncbi:MAG: glycosyltransferase family 39 protein [Terriglobales bacterium]
MDHSIRCGSWERLYWVGLAAVIGCCWVLPLNSPLWLDETVTYWTIRGGLLDIARRCPLNSIPYSILIWSVDQAFGRAEAVLRLPSLVGAAAAAHFLYRLAAEQYDCLTARSAVALFSATTTVAYAAADARPYALGLAVVVASSLFLSRWIQSGRYTDAIWYGLLAGLIPHFHLVFALVAVPQLVYLLIGLYRGQVRWRVLVIAAMCGGLLVGPLFPQFIQALRTSAEHSFARSYSVNELLTSIFRYYWLIAIVGAVALQGQFSSGLVWPRQRTFLVLVVTWAVLPPGLLWIVSLSDQTHLFLPRYVLSSAPASALLFAAILRPLKTRAVHHLALAIMCLVSVGHSVMYGWVFEHSRSRGNWREALRFAEATTAVKREPVFVRSALPEANSMDWRRDPVSDSVFFAPASYYRTKTRLVPLPVTLSEELRDYARQQVAGHTRFLLISLDHPTPVASALTCVDRWFVRWKRSLLADFDGLRVYEYRGPDYRPVLQLK